MVPPPPVLPTAGSRRLLRRAEALLLKGDDQGGLALLDRYLEAATRHACGPGCAACCDHWVDDVSPREVGLLQTWIRQHLPHEVGVFQRRCAEDTAVWESLGPDAHAAFHALKRPCPLLGSDLRCRAWPARPLTCRTFFREPQGPGPRCDGATGTFLVHPGHTVLVLLGQTPGGLRDQLARALA